MTIFEIISVLLGLLGLLGGVVGFIRAVAADRRSAEAEAVAADAQSDAAAALKQSAAATERIAAAVEIIASRGAPAPAGAQGSLMADRISAELNALIGSSQVEWSVEHRLPLHSYRLRNVGTARAYDVTILGGSPAMGTPLASIDAGTAVTFHVDPDQHSRAVEVSWREGDPATRSRLTLPLPSDALPPSD
jgi:hypothetical protein